MEDRFTMIIFVEGPDNVGKGTQITRMYKEIAKRNEYYPYWVHYSNFGVDQIEQYSFEAYSMMFEIYNQLFY